MNPPRSKRHGGHNTISLALAMSWIEFVLGMMIGIPQLIKTIRTKSAPDVSVTTYVLIVATCTCLLIRSLAIREPAFIFYYVSLIISSFFQLYLTWKYRAHGKDFA